MLRLLKKSGKEISHHFEKRQFHTRKFLFNVKDEEEEKGIESTKPNSTFKKTIEITKDETGVKRNINTEENIKTPTLQLNRKRFSITSIPKEKSQPVKETNINRFVKKEVNSKESVETKMEEVVQKIQYQNPIENQNVSQEELKRKRFERIRTVAKEVKDDTQVPEKTVTTIKPKVIYYQKSPQQKGGKIITEKGQEKSSIEIESNIQNVNEKKILVERTTTKREENSHVVEKVMDDVKSIPAFQVEGEAVEGEAVEETEAVEGETDTQKIERLRKKHLKKMKTPLIKTRTKKALKLKGKTLTPQRSKEEIEEEKFKRRGRRDRDEDEEEEEVEVKEDDRSIEEIREQFSFGMVMTMAEPLSKEMESLRLENGFENLLQEDHDKVENTFESLDFHRYEKFQKFYEYQAQAQKEKREELANDIKEGRISSEKAEQIQKSQPALYLKDVYVPTTFSKDFYTMEGKLHSFGQDIEKIYQYLKDIKESEKDVVLAKEKLMEIEINELLDSGKTKEEIIAKYSFEIPYRELVDQFYDEYQTRIELFREDPETLLETIMNNYFVNRGRALLQLKGVNIEEKGDKWEDWLTPEQVYRLKVAFTMKFEEFLETEGEEMYKASKKAQTLPQESLDSFDSLDLDKKKPETYGEALTNYYDDYIDYHTNLENQMENHSIVRGAKILNRIMEIENTKSIRLPSHYIQDLPKSKYLIRKYNIGVMVPFEKYYDKFLEQIPPGIARDRFIAHGRALSKNPTLTPTDKVNHMKNLLGVYQKYKIPESYKEHPKHELYQKLTTLHEKKVISWVEQRERDFERIAAEQGVVANTEETNPDKQFEME